jgi:hypothetical protein
MKIRVLHVGRPGKDEVGRAQIRNNFTYRIFFIFEIKFELKFKEVSMS